jgi:hypothetical protein
VFQFNLFVLTHLPIVPNAGCVGGDAGLYVTTGSAGLKMLCASVRFAKIPNSAINNTTTFLLIFMVCGL